MYYVILFAILILGALGYTIYNKRVKNRQPSKPQVDVKKGNESLDNEAKPTIEDEKVNDLLKRGTVMARIADNITGRIYNTEVTKDTLHKIIQKYGTLGRQWNREGTKIYGFNRFVDESGAVALQPIIPPSEATNSPTDLYNHMQQPEIPILMDMREEKSWAQKFGQVLWWVAVMAFIMFLWATNK